MTAASPPTNRDARLDKIVTDYLEAERAGHRLDRAEILTRNPDLAKELREFFADHDWMAQLAKPGADADPEATVIRSLADRRYVDQEPYRRGGLGEVLTARDSELNRTVALKRLQDRFRDDPESQRRFLVEAEITARLEHPGIVPVHSLYEDDDRRPTYAMRLIEGATLADAIGKFHASPMQPVAFRRLLQSFVSVCRTIGFAHSRGVVHRDLKPANIMLGKFGETLVVDWGLAKVIGRQDSFEDSEPAETLRPAGHDQSTPHETKLGTAVGTPAFMSPEQAAGRWDIIGPATDIYGLGAVLYALLTGRAPVEGKNWPEINQKIQRGDFRSPKEVLRSLPGALDAICRKCMAVEPDSRFQSAEDVAVDVECWLADEPVSVHREPLTTRLRRWSRKHRGSVATIATIMVLLPTTLGMWQHSLRQERINTLEQELAAKDYSRNAVANMEELNYLRRQTRSLEGLIQQLTEELPKFAAAENQSATLSPESALEQCVRFFDHAIEKDQQLKAGGTRWTVFFRIHRAQCLAFLNKHEAAFAEVDALAERPRQIQSGWVPAVFRIFAIVITVADQPEVRLQAVERAGSFLQVMKDDDYFDNRQNLNRLREESSLQPLITRPEIEAFLEELDTE